MVRVTIIHDWVTTFIVVWQLTIKSPKMMTSQTHFFEIIRYDVIFLLRNLKDALIPKISSKLQFPMDIQGIKVWWMNEWINEWMCIYIPHVSQIVSWRHPIQTLQNLFRFLQFRTDSKLERFIWQGSIKLSSFIFQLGITIIKR